MHLSLLSNCIRLLKVRESRAEGRVWAEIFSRRMRKTALMWSPPLSGGISFSSFRRGGTRNNGLTSATGTPSGGRQCRTIIPLIGTSFPWGSCSKFFLRSVWGDKRQLSGVKCYGQPGLNPLQQLTRRPASGSACHDLQNPLQPL